MTKKEKIKAWVKNNSDIIVLTGIAASGAVAGYYFGHKFGFRSGAVSAVDGLYDNILENGGTFFRKYTRRTDPGKIMYILAEEGHFSEKNGCLAEVFNNPDKYLSVITKEAK